MTGVTTLRVATRSYATVAATYETYQTGPAGPDIYATIVRRGRWRWRWTIWTTGSVDTELGWGRAWTHDGAVGQAIKAAHRPGVTGAVR